MKISNEVSLLKEPKVKLIHIQHRKGKHGRSYEVVNTPYIHQFR